jgi:hypothetical protein
MDRIEGRKRMSDSKKEEQEGALSTVEQLARQLGVAENTLERGYAQLASALLTVQENRYWEGYFESWGKYIEHITNIYNLGKAQLYHKVAVVRELDGIVELKDLTNMGISKASVLADVARMNNGIVPNDAIAAAQDDKTTVKDLKKKVHEILNVPQPQDGEWFDLGFAFYVTPEEKQELQEAMTAAQQADPVISNTIKDFMQRKEIALRWAREFLATYSSVSEMESSRATEDGMPPVEDADIVEPDEKADF